MTTDNQIVDAADRLSEHIEELVKESRQAQARAARETGRIRRFLKIALPIFLIDLGLTFGLLALHQQTNNSINDFKQAQYTTCVASNDSRQRVDIVWHKFVNLLFASATKPITPAEQKTINELNIFLKSVDNIYKPVSCNAYR